MPLLRTANALLLAMAIALLPACGGGGGGTSLTPDLSDTDDGKTGDPEDPGAEVPEPGDVSTASIYRGTSQYDNTYRVINSAISVLDTYGDPIDHLDGGDFFGSPDVDPEDTEGHHDTQKLDYGTHLSGSITLMLDISDSMAEGGRFEELKRAAQDFVRAMAAFGLAVDVYAFDRVESPVGAVAGGGDPTALLAAIDALEPGTVNTYFYDIIAARVIERNLSGINAIDYPHTQPLSAPDVHVDLMVILSEGRDNSGRPNEIEKEKAGRFSIASIALGENPNLEVLEGISEFLFTVPEGGDYADAVEAAVARLQNYYHGFYLVDYMPTVIEGTKASYELKLVDNTGAALRVTYEPDVAGLKDLPTLPAYCCRIHAAPGEALDPESLPRDSAVEFHAVKVWTHSQPAFAWDLANSDGGMTLTQGDDTSAVTITTNSAASTGTLTASATAPESWTSAPITLKVP